MAVAADEQHNKSAVAPSLCCSHFKVKCAETHVTTEARILSQTCDYLDSRRPTGLRCHSLCRFDLPEISPLPRFGVFLSSLRGSCSVELNDHGNRNAEMRTINAAALKLEVLRLNAKKTTKSGVLPVHCRVISCI